MEHICRFNPGSFSCGACCPFDFTTIAPHAGLAGLEYDFVEQGDNFAVDPMRSITDSAAHVTRYLKW